MKCAVLALLLLGAVALSHGAGDDPTVNIPGVVDLSECVHSDPPAGPAIVAAFALRLLPCWPLLQPPPTLPASTAARGPP